MADHEDFSRLDHGAFKAFAAAGEALNFTVAAEKAAMTQSGVSQHVARLEAQLGTRLFTRVNKKVLLTKAGALLLEFIDRQREETERLFERVHGETERLSGKVRYGMPHSCLFTPHFPLLLRKRAEFQQVDLEVRLMPSEVIFDRLLDRHLDFGFVTAKRDNPALRFEPFAREEYVMVGGNRNLLRSLNRKNILSQNFVSYPGMNILFDLWSRHHFGPEGVSFESLKIAGAIDGLHGAITMLEHGVGLSVLPRHCVESQLESGILFESARSRKGALLNDILIATLSGAAQPRRVRAVIDAFWTMKIGGVKGN